MSHSTRPRVYVAGALSADTDEEIEANCLIAVQASDQLLKAGFAPFCPHLSIHWHKVHPNEYEDWLEMDFAFIEACDALLKISDSPGADREEVFARKIGIPVYRYVEVVIEAKNFIIEHRKKRIAETMEFWLQNAPIHSELVGTSVAISQVRKNPNKEPQYFSNWFAEKYLEIFEFRKHF